MRCMRLLPAKNISVTQVNYDDDDDDGDDVDGYDDVDDEYDMMMMIMMLNHHPAVELLLGHIRLSLLTHR